MPPLSALRTRLAPHFGLLAECLALVVLVRVGLTLSSYKTLRQLLLRGDATEPAAALDAARIAWAVRNAARLVPHATCLTQALAGQVALARRGKASQLKIGVAPAPDGALRAHAWLISDGRIILGGNSQSVADFTPLAEFGSGSR